MKKLIIIILAIFILAGCSDYREINDLAIVSAMSIGEKGENLEVAIQVINPQQTNQASESSYSSIIVYKAEGKTLDYALTELAKQSPKHLFLSHLKALVIDSKILESERVEVFDFLSRYQESRLNYNLYVTEDINPSEIIGILTPIEDVPALYVNSLLKNNKHFLSSTKEITFLDFLTQTLENGLNPVFPLLTMKKSDDSEDRKEEESSDKNTSLEEAVMNNYLVLENLITFNSKNELLKLNQNQSISYNIITNNIENSVLPVPCNEEKIILLNINKSSAKIKPDLKNNIVNIEVKIEGNVEENRCKLDLNSESVLSEIETKANKEITKYLTDTINYAQENNNDFLGIGNVIYKSNPKYFDFKNRDWDTEGFSNLNIEVKSDFSIFITGDLRKNIDRKEVYEKD